MPTAETVSSVGDSAGADIGKVGEGDAEEPKEPNLDLVEYDDIIIPPDGGYGWIIVFAAFWSNMLVDGTVFGFPVILPALMNSMLVAGFSCAHVDQIAGWIPALLAACYFIAGPFVSTIANRKGFRVVAFIGGIIAAIGFIVTWAVVYNKDVANVTEAFLSCGKVNSTEMTEVLKADAGSLAAIFVCSCVVGGFGCGMLYLPAVVATGFYFDKNMSLACGIALCGSGVGTTIFPIIIGLIVDRFNWTGALIFFAMAMLFSSGFGLLYLPLKSIKVARDQYYEELRVGSGSSFHAAVSMKVVKQIKEEDYVMSEDGNRVLVGNSVQSIVAGAGAGSRITQAYGTLETKGSSQRATMSWGASSSLTKTPTLTNPDPVDTSQDPQPQPQPQPPQISQCAIICKEIIDFSLVSSPTFLVWAFSCFISMLGVFVPFVYIPNPDEMPPAHIEYFLMTIGIGNIIGRISGGLVCNIPKVNVLLVSNICLTTMGVAQILVPLLRPVRQQIWSMYLFSIVYGIAMGGVNALIPVLLTSLLGVDKLAASFGLTTFMLAFGVLLGTPIPGLIAAIENGYNLGFIIAGIFLVVSAVMLYPINCLKRWEQNKQDRKDSKERLVEKVEVLEE